MVVSIGTMGPIVSSWAYLPTDGCVINPFQDLRNLIRLFEDLVTSLAIVSLSVPSLACLFPQYESDTTHSVWIYFLHDSLLVRPHLVQHTWKQSSRWGKTRLAAWCWWADSCKPWAPTPTLQAHSITNSWYKPSPPPILRLEITNEILSK
jgi:hypothetical protein